MPIDFPTNPTSGQTYSYNSITWEYNGVAWDKQGGGGSVGPQGNTGATGATGPQGNTGATGPVGNYVISFNGLTGAVTGVTTGIANTFVALQSFTSGISASGGMTLAGSFEGSTATFNGNVRFTSGLSASGSILLHNTTTIDVDTYNTLFDGLKILQPSLTISANELTQYGLVISANNLLGVDEGAAASIRAVGVSDEGIEYSNNLEFSTNPCLDNNAGIIQFNPQDISALVVSPISVFTAVPFISGVTATFSGNVIGKIVNSVNGITGAINLAAGSNITITPSGLTLTIASTGGGAGFTRSINVITSSTTAGGTASVDYVYIGNTSGNINLTLPTAVSNANRYTVKNSNIGILTVLTTSSQTIDGVTGYNLSKQFQAIDLLSDNSNWVVV